MSPAWLSLPSPPTAVCADARIVDNEQLYVCLHVKLEPMFVRMRVALPNGLPRGSCTWSLRLRYETSQIQTVISVATHVPWWPWCRLHNLFDQADSGFKGTVQGIVILTTISSLSSQNISARRCLLTQEECRKKSDRPTSPPNKSGHFPFAYLFPQRYAVATH